MLTLASSQLPLEGCLAKESGSRQQTKLIANWLLCLSWFLSGTLADGKVFDSSRSRGKPFKFKIGHQEVIRGWEEGVAQVRSWESPGHSLLVDIIPVLSYSLSYKC